MHNKNNERIVRPKLLLNFYKQIHSGERKQGFDNKQSVYFMNLTLNFSIKKNQQKLINERRE